MGDLALLLQTMMNSPLALSSSSSTKSRWSASPSSSTVAPMAPEGVPPGGRQTAPAPFQIETLNAAKT